MSVGDLMAVNASLLQLSIPFNFIGYTYQELRQSYVDMQFMKTVLTTSRSSVTDANSHVGMNDSVHVMATLVSGSRAVWSSRMSHSSTAATTQSET